MPTYPPVVHKTKRIRPMNDIDVDIADDGTLRAQDLGATAVYEIELEHPLVTQADVDELLDFWTANKDSTITTQTLADGHTYDCLHVNQPSVVDVNAIRKNVTQKLVGTRN